jgi:hypothetical protein
LQLEQREQALQQQGQASLEREQASRGQLEQASLERQRALQERAWLELQQA